jgi:alpha-glucosidase
VTSTDRAWWRDAVVYQIYPRSFADGNNDGTGDVRGMIERLDYLADLGVNAVWVSPWYPSPMADGGYDVADYCDIDPSFGTLADADDFLAGAHERGIRVLIDLVPNHSSVEHPAFRAALAAGPGSPERAMFHFLDGTGPDGSLPPNNWGSLFGGPAWERVVGPEGPEQWYLHMFAPEQPDWDWANPAVVALFDDVIRFWFDRGVDGLRVDVADGLAKAAGYPDTPIDPDTGLGIASFYPGHPWWNQPELDAIQRHWREIADGYADRHLGMRIFVCEANTKPLDALMRFVDPGRMHTTFNFDMLWCEWEAGSLRAMIDRNLVAHAGVGAPTTWVLSNHDSTRVVSRYGKPETGKPFTLDGPPQEWLHRFADYFNPLPTDNGLGRRRARAAALLELALPGPAYIYQGEELGLPEVEDLPDCARQDPSFFRTGGRTRGRDGCRVPLPWSGGTPPYGFGVDAQPWLPQPPEWAALSAEAQDGDPDSTLTLYRRALAIRGTHPALGDGTLVWGDTYPGKVLYFTREPGFGCLVNLSGEPAELPGGAEVLVASAPLVDGRVPTDTAVWLTLPG